MRKSRIVVPLMAVAVMLNVVTTAVASHNKNGPQTTGGVIINSFQSEGSIYVSRDRPADYYSVVPTGKRSDQPVSRPIMKNVQGFKVANGYNAINVKTGYTYVGGEWHYMCCNNTVLTLRVDWLGNNSSAVTVAMDHHGNPVVVWVVRHHGQYGLAA